MYTAPRTALEGYSIGAMSKAFDSIQAIVGTINSPQRRKALQMDRVSRTSDLRTVQEALWQLPSAKNTPGGISDSSTLRSLCFWCVRSTPVSHLHSAKAAVEPGLVAVEPSGSSCCQRQCTALQ